MKSYNFVALNFIKRVVVVLLILPIFLACSKDDDGNAKSNSIIAIGEKSIILRSDDGGVNWTKSEVTSEAKVSGGENVKLQDVIFASGKWVAVGGVVSTSVNKSVILTSVDDGLTWQLSKSPASSYLSKITYSNGFFWAGGFNYQLLKSKDAITWEKIDLTDILTMFTGMYSRKYIKDIYVNGSNIVVSGYLYYTSYGGSYSSLVIESKDNGNTWKTCSVGGEYYDKIIPYQDKIYLIGKKYLGKRENGKWSYDNRSGQPQIFAPCLTHGNKIVALSKLQANTKLLIGENGKWERLGTGISNLGSYNLLYGNGKYVLLGTEIPLDDYDKGPRATIYVTNENEIEWKKGREILGDKFFGYNIAFMAGVFSHNNFIIANSEYTNPKVSSEIFYCKDGISWKNAIMPQLEVDEQIIKIVNAN